MYSIIEMLLNYLIKKSILTFSSMEESFFVYKKLDKKLKLTPEIIALNYTKDSPYSEKESNITSIINHPNLYLWFYKENEKKKHIPEALCLFRELNLKYDNTICIFEDSINKVLVIKENRLVASFIKKSIQQRDIALIKDEFFLDKVVQFSKQEYVTYQKEYFKHIAYTDILSILNISIDFKSIFNRIVKWSALPFLVSSILLTAVIGGYDFYQKSQNENLLSMYRNSTKNTVEIKENINKNEALNEVFNSMKNEFKYIDKTLIVSEIIKSTNDLNMTLDFIRISNNNVDFIVKTKNEEKIPLYTQKLFKCKLFSDIKNISSQKIRKNITKATMQAKLKERQ